MSIRLKIQNIFCSPGRQHQIQFAAPTQFVSKSDNYQVVSEEISQHALYNSEERKPLGGRMFDHITQYAGSRISFLITLLIIVIWAIVGAVLGAPEYWQIAMQNGSSIQCYISDTLLMRQQQNHCQKLLIIISQLRSRITTVGRLLRDSDICKSSQVVVLEENIEDNTNIAEASIENAIFLPNEHWFDRCCNFASIAVGSIYSLIFYWGGIIAWIALGKMLEYSNLWQLYINTAVAVELTFTSMFLQNTRRRHMEYLEKCLKSIMLTDCELETLLRKSTGDNEPNPIITIYPCAVSRAVRAIDYYGDVIGSGVGAAISAAVFTVWICIGNIMGWSDNWWLIIGTYTGLVGFVDGFVLRNVYFRQDMVLDKQFQVLAEMDESLLQYLNVNVPTKPVEQKPSLINKISNQMGVLCATPTAVLISLFIVLALIGIASGMSWNQTGQLLCNTPTMILEGFLLIVLIQAHNLSHMKRRIQLHDILVRRISLLKYAKAITGAPLDEKNVTKYVLDPEKLSKN